MLGYQVNPLSVDWESQNKVLFFNERQGQKKLFLSYVKNLPNLKAHIWISSSGRYEQKWVALSKKAFLISAGAVNQHISATSKDCWALTLPLFHVGGLAILARAFLSQTQVKCYREKWSAKSFVKFLREQNITLTSLVPTQVYDLVQVGLPCPPTLKAIIVGGEHLSPTLYHLAQKLNYPLLPSYGLTEVCSQVATAKLSKKPVSDITPPKALDSLNGESAPPPLKILPHVEIKIVKGEIAIRSQSLFTGFLPLIEPATGKSSSKAKLKKGFQYRKKSEWYFTKDKGEVKKGFLALHHSGQIKILGEKIPMQNLEEAFLRLTLKHRLPGRYLLLPIPHARQGFQIALVSDSFSARRKIEAIIKDFNSLVSPYEKIRQLYFVPCMPLTGISKISRQALLKQLHIAV